jgi:molybdopterin molybdotransferase
MDPCTESNLNPLACGEAQPAPRLTRLDEALTQLLAAIDPIGDHERVSLKKATGRILAKDIFAHHDIPPFRNSAMDGYALRVADLPLARTTGLRLLGASLAGHPYSGQCEPGGCVRILTGAPVPEGADAVVMQEFAQRQDDRVHLRTDVKAGEYIRPAGDDVRAGAPLLVRGKRLNAADLGLLAADGRYDVPVIRRLRVAYFSTGDELKPIAQPLGFGDIHDSNRYTLHALLQHPWLQAIDLGVARDEPRAVRQVLADAAAIADVVISTGGVSVGEADFVTGALADLGRIDYWKLAIKPGKPLAIGQIEGAWFFGLPGNPVAVIVTFWQVVRPALLRLTGTEIKPPLRLRATCDSLLKKVPGRLEFQRGRYEMDAAGTLRVSVSGGQGSHQLAGISQANCLIVLPADNAGVAPGEPVEIEPLDANW